MLRPRSRVWGVFSGSLTSKCQLGELFSTCSFVGFSLLLSMLQHQ